MHLFLMTRGINQQVEIWKKFMETQWFWFKQEPFLKDADGKFIPDGVDDNGKPKFKVGPVQWTKVQGALRPIEFWEYVFPEETLPYNKNMVMNDKTLPQMLAALKLHKNEPVRKEVAPMTWVMRKLLNAQKIPIMPDEIVNADPSMITDHIIPTEAVAVYPVGIRYDNHQDFLFKGPKGEDIGFRQEGL